jgi:hypothetical protein
VEGGEKFLTRSVYTCQKMRPTRARGPRADSAKIDGGIAHLIYLPTHIPALSVTHDPCDLDTNAR